jgi:hypothetical protein
MRKLMGLVSVALGGCVTFGSDVVPVGKDTYQLSMTGVGFATQANTNINALKAARLLRQHRKTHGAGEFGGVRCLRLVAEARQSRIQVLGRE